MTKQLVVTVPNGLLADYELSEAIVRGTHLSIRDFSIKEV